MNSRVCILSALLVLGTASVANSAESKAVQTISGILLSLQHMPSAADRQALEQIAMDKSAAADERSIAEALMHFQHRVVAADKPMLEAIVNSAKAAGADRTLAGILLGLHHFPSDADKQKLKLLLQ